MSVFIKIILQMFLFKWVPWVQFWIICASPKTCMSKKK